MLKKLSVILCMLFISGMIFAQTAEGFAEEAIGITDSDCKNFAKNYSKIEKEIENLSDSDSLADLDRIIGKYGISGPNEYFKLLGIMNCATLIGYEKQLKADPLSAAIIKKTTGDPTVTVKSTVGKSDYEAVLKNYKGVATALGLEEEPEQKDDLTIGGVIGGALGGKKGENVGKGVDVLIKKKGKSEKVKDHLGE